MIVYKEALVVIVVVPTIENINIRHIIEKAVAENAIIIDVRSRSKFISGHIPMAMNIPFEEIMKGRMRIPLNRTLIVYCEQGSNSIRAARMLAENGYRVINAVGGIRQYNKDLTVSRQ